LRNKSSKKEKKKAKRKTTRHPKWWKGEIGEIVDWIDKRGKIIGTVTKKFAHDHALLHHAVHVFVLNGKKELIIQKRSKNMRTLPGKWDTSVGGHVKSGETMMQAVKRECKEELGINVSPKKLGWMDISNSEKNYHNLERVTYFVAKTSQKIKIQKSELSGIKWVPLKEVDAFIEKNRKNCGPMFVKGWETFGKKIIKMIK
jgi:isopentenyl-diphosphate delta-isomerase type 1